MNMLLDISTFHKSELLMSYEEVEFTFDMVGENYSKEIVKDIAERGWTEIFNSEGVIFLRIKMRKLLPHSFGRQKFS